MQLKGFTMEETVLLTNLAIFLLLAAACSIVFNRVRLPPLIGYLMAGIIIVNFWTPDDNSTMIVDMLSDMGLIMLMFCIGMEINLKKIRKQGVFAIEVALVQLPLMVLGGIIAGGFLGFDTIQCICLGAIISGSSTAVVMAVLKTQNRLDKDHIDTLVLITIMEDIGQVIILSMITPLMAGSELDAGGLAAMIVSILAFMIVSILAGLKLMPRMINWVSDNVSSEVLVIFAVGLAFGMSLIASFVGLSVAIGAFLMGMMMASSRKSKEILHDIEPMKNIFMAMFFISVGMEIALGTLVENLVLIIIIYLTFATLKTATVFLGYWIGNEAPRNGFVSAVSLCAMGEFAFIIAKQALDYGVVDDAFYTSVVGAALLSMIMLPILTKSSTTLWDNASSKCPAPVMDLFNRVNGVRSSFYGQISNASKRTRREVNSRMTRSYILILLVVVIQTLFLLITPSYMDWTMKYFGGIQEFWGMLILLANLFAIFIPLYRLISNMKFITKITTKNAERVYTFGTKGNLVGAALRTNNTILALMIDITILIIVPNGLDFWIHLVVLFIALVMLIYFNKRVLEKKSEQEEVKIKILKNENIKMLKCFIIR